ncbi:MAG TPA: alpha/beta hydrolase-fold protein [Thermoanaerobaculia bacterium]|nr:alpha/beta hydrolase-fold protein [Thermoanaerobaculia bacterium]
MPTTTIEVHYPSRRGELGLRGSAAPLSWKESLAPQERDGGRHRFTLDLPAGSVLELKPVLDGGRFSTGRNYNVLAGDTLVLQPTFEKTHGTLEEEVRSMPAPQLGRAVRYRVFLPPSYDEYEERRYPVLYAQDGQALFTSSPDPIDGKSWRMDAALDELWELGAMEEVLVVAVYTDFGRLEMLSPTADDRHGGGDGPGYRDFLIETLKPEVDARWRTLAGRGETALIGASMGGLFSFFAAWTRPDVFGRAACLSSSFWWGGRAMVREVQKGSCPFPRPWLYIDSGAAKNALEEDANLRDGFEHTVALRTALVSHCYVPGEDIHCLAYAGLSHDNDSWASRLAIPLQLLFPRRG